MKIFGKRKSKPASEGTEKKADEPPATDSTPAAAPTPQEENVTSYFSNITDDTPKKKKAKKNPTNEINGDEMETLLAMDYEKLNSKQRRLVRRHRERSGEDVGAEKSADAGDVCAASNAGADASTTQEITSKDDDKTDKVTEAKASTETDLASNMTEHEKELLTKLEGLNSKDRRKFLRQLKTDNPNNVDIDKLEEEAKRIAERNIRDSKDQEKQSATPKKLEPKPAEPAKSTKKKKVKDLSHLPPEEIARREKQRQMQVEAAERRARGEDLNNGHKHPLNSERRRANRRKPARKSQGKGGARREFNSVGYQMRKNA